MTSTYPSYKPTPIPWLPQIPEHWNVRKAKHLFKERSEKGYPDEPLLAATQTKGVVFKEDYETRTVTAQKDFHLLKLVKKEDFVISLRSFQGGFEFAHQQGIISPAYTVFCEKTSKEVDKGFYRHLFKSNPFISSLTLFVTGIREGQNIEYSEFKDSLLPLPPLPEQTAIANYLDAKTDEINTFIAKKEKLIVLLKEQKQAIINELLQDKEGRWERRKLKYVARVRTGRTPSIEKSRIDFFKEGSINWITPGDFNDDYILAESARKIIPLAISCNEVELFSPNSLYLIGIGGTLGKVGLSPNRASANQQINVISFCNKILPEFGLFYFQSIREFLFKTADYTTLPILNQSKTKNIKVPVPKLAEQEDIVKQIKEKQASVDIVILRINNEIELVKGLKQSLIAEVVTGKIKVA